MMQKICAAACAVCLAVLVSVPCVFADDAAGSSASSSATSDSSDTLLGDAEKLNGALTDNFSGNVDSVTDILNNAPGELEYNTKDDFPKFIKESLSFVPLSFWWAFQFSILLGFINALYRRMS